VFLAIVEKIPPSQKIYISRFNAELGQVGIKGVVLQHFVIALPKMGGFNVFF